MIDDIPDENTTTAPTSNSSLTSRYTLWGPKRDPLYIVVPMTVMYGIILICGVIGNVSTCIVIARNKHMHTATNYYLFSLAVSDLLLLLSGLPPEMYHIWSMYPYIFGETVCVLTGLASETSANATVLTITAFTVERYVAICHPFLSHTVSKLSRAIKFVIIIWILALCLAIPQALQVGIVYEKKNGTIVSEEYKVCGVEPGFSSYSFGLSGVLFFLTPMLLITVLYILIGIRLQRSSQVARRGLPESQSSRYLVRGSQRGYAQTRSTRRVVKMLVAVVVAFFICWAPFQAQRLFAVYGYEGEKTSPGKIKFYKTVTYASGLLYYLSTTVNPILYNIMSLKFRQAFKSTLTKCFKRKNDLQSCGGDAVCSSGGCGGGSGGTGGTGRLQYAVLSRRSSRNNNSLSSGNSVTEDLTRRPLVVSFRRRSQRTSSTSLDYASSPERRINYTPNLGLVDLVETSVTSKESVTPHEEPRINNTWTPPSKSLNNKIPRIEDIEIFQESHLKIQKSVKKKQGHNSNPQSSSTDYITEKEKCISTSVDKEKNETNIVRKSSTLPCMLVDSM
ncbi:pyrokinin-1 receptor-like [Lycorma delicatula]|uniref:pyrokinin-1 receptor-like n=1 Tax=Lycorma delicatula TaxID=130591 RepID=UPI003F50F01C